MKHTEPKIDHREAQPYMGIRKSIKMDEMDKVIPEYIDEIMAWLNTEGIASTGAPFMRYYVINMSDLLDVELAFPVAEALQGTDRIKAGVLPAGRYASLIYTDVTKGIEGNGILIGWAEKQGLKWDRWDDPQGDAFASRYEIFLTGPEDDPDPANWDTEVAIKLAD